MRRGKGERERKRKSRVKKQNAADPMETGPSLSRQASHGHRLKTAVTVGEPFCKPFLHAALCMKCCEPQRTILRPRAIAWNAQRLIRNSRC